MGGGEGGGASGGEGGGGSVEHHSCVAGVERGAGGGGRGGKQENRSSPSSFTRLVHTRADLPHAGVQDGAELRGLVQAGSCRLVQTGADWCYYT